MHKACPADTPLKGFYLKMFTKHTGITLTVLALGWEKKLNFTFLESCGVSSAAVLDISASPLLSEASRKLVTFNLTTYIAEKIETLPWDEVCS